jgi:adenosine deaminase
MWTNLSELEKDLVSVPKIMLHTHLEGSLRPETLIKMVKRNNISLSFDPMKDNLSHLVQANNWQSFRSVYYQICSCFVHEADYYESVYEYGCHLSEQGVIYCELMFSPWRHLSRGVSLNVVSDGFLRAINDLENDCGIVIRIVCDFVRNKDEDCYGILRWMKNISREYFVGISISGGSGAVDRSNYKKYVDIGRGYGYKITAHAGELEGPESVVEVLKYFGVDRVGHGVRCVEDETLIKSMVEEGMHFELCPTANKVVGLSCDQCLIIKDFIKSGVNFSVNTDDELIFNTDILKEYRCLLDYNIISFQDVFSIQENALNKSFVSFGVKKELLKRMGRNDL